MPLEIFYFEPDLVEPREYSSAWSTLVTQFDSGTGQFQPDWERNINDFKFIYEGYFDDSRWNPIEAFFNTHKGRGYPFYLPSWRAETVLTQAYSSGVYLYVGNVQFFSSISGKPGNLVHVKHLNGSPEEVRKIVGINETEKKITIDSAFDNAYSAGSVVQIAYKVRFGVDKMPPLKYTGFDIYACEIPFIEDV